MTNAIEPLDTRISDFLNILSDNGVTFERAPNGGVYSFTYEYYNRNGKRETTSDLDILAYFDENGEIGKTAAALQLERGY